MFVIHENAMNPRGSAADQGEPSALYNLALMYARGDGVEKDDDEAYRLLRLSAEQGFELAMKIVGDI